MVMLRIARVVQRQSVRARLTAESGLPRLRHHCLLAVELQAGVREGTRQLCALRLQRLQLLLLRLVRVLNLLQLLACRGGSQGDVRSMRGADPVDVCAHVLPGKWCTPLRCPSW